MGVKVGSRCWELESESSQVRIRKWKLESGTVLVAPYRVIS